MKHVFLSVLAITATFNTPAWATFLKRGSIYQKDISAFQGLWIVERPSSHGSPRQTSVVIAQCSGRRNDMVERTYFKFEDLAHEGRAYEAIQALADQFKCTDLNFQDLRRLMVEIVTNPLYLQQQSIQAPSPMIEGEIGGWFLMDPGPPEWWHTRWLMGPEKFQKTSHVYQDWITPYSRASKTLGQYEVSPNEQFWSLTKDGDLLVRHVLRNSRAPEPHSGRPKAHVMYRPMLIKKL